MCLQVPGVASSRGHPCPPLHGHSVLEPSDDSFEADERQNVEQQPSFVNIRGANHHFFKYYGGGGAPRWKQDTFLEVIIVLGKPLEAAFDTEEKTVASINRLSTHLTVYHSTKYHGAGRTLRPVSLL